MKVETKLANIHLRPGVGCKTEYHAVSGSEARDFSVLVFRDWEGSEVHVYTGLEGLEAIRDSVEGGIHDHRVKAEVPAGDE